MKETIRTKTGLLATGSAMAFVVLLGFTSLFSDVTYEGARGAAGQFMQVLGASAFAVGVTAGAGELLGYGLRLMSGLIADRTRRYWLITLVGYGVNLLAVPALALVGRWEIAMALLFAERIGKAIRTPSRDAMLSHATSQMGHGFGFGLHEAMDQVGAFLGPLIVAAALYAKGTGQADLAAYHTAFAVLLIPALLALTTLIIARALFPRPAELESKTLRIGVERFGRPYWLYVIAAGLIALGFADFPLMAYHFRAAALTPDEWIPTFYSFAMAIDAIAALVFGRLFDRKGLPVLALACALSACFGPFVFYGGLPAVLVGLTLWGIGMGAQESIMRAAIASMVSPTKRATAYGVFHTAFGVCWFAGSALMGFLYDRSLFSLVVFSVVIQLTAIPLLLGIRAEKLAT